jgi:hypothetical protein
MNEDSKLQFTLFTFGITTSTVVLGFLTSPNSTGNLSVLPGIPTGFSFLVPLIVLIPTSLAILNRARTRNRKAAYIIVNFDYRRLRAEGVTDETPLAEVRQRPFLPWETALHILDRTNMSVSPSRRVHLGRILRYMAICYFVVEALCIFLSISTSRLGGSIMVLIMQILLALLILFAFFYRLNALAELTKTLSIQGYVENWLNLRYGNLERAPKYFREWIGEYHRQSPRNPQRP